MTFRIRKVKSKIFFTGCVFQGRNMESEVEEWVNTLLRNDDSYQKTVKSKKCFEGCIFQGKNK